MVLRALKMPKRYLAHVRWSSMEGGLMQRASKISHLNTEKRWGYGQQKGSPHSTVLGRQPHSLCKMGFWDADSPWWFLFLSLLSTPLSLSPLLSFPFCPSLSLSPLLPPPCV